MAKAPLPPWRLQPLPARSRRPARSLPRSKRFGARVDMSTASQPVVHTDTHHPDDHHGPVHGWRRWLFATNHKDIGTMYLVFSLTMFFVGGLMAMVIRAELFK